ncbi:MAG TPA: hypothetical protein VLK33_23050 [Terriglobales bacterium]|nr:hypothetical protein [Terriglobales bacterium]
MNNYAVTWQTEIGMGAVFYQGKETICADDMESAEAIVQFNVWRRMFQDWPKSHVVITKVEVTKR